MNFNDPDNSGLASCLLQFGWVHIYTLVCSYLSLADFFVIASEALMIRGHEDYDAKHLWEPGTFSRYTLEGSTWGRVTKADC